MIHARLGTSVILPVILTCMTHWIALPEAAQADEQGLDRQRAGDHQYIESHSHLAWVAKAGRILRGGRSLSVARTRELGALPAPAVVETLLHDADFGDMVLDFNLFYLGFRGGFLYDLRPDNQRRYHYLVTAKPQAIQAAQEVMRGGDWFKIYDLVQPRYLQPLNEPEREGLAVPDDTPDAEVRRLWLVRATAAMDTLIAGFRSETDPAQLDKARGCRLRNENQDGLDEIYEFFDRAGFDFIVGFDLRTLPDVAVNISCGDRNVTAEQLVALLGQQRDMMVAAIDASAEFTPENYPIRSVADLKAIPAGSANPWLDDNQMGFFGFWQHLPNSSTNYNRKRAAYMLKTFFCDDLTPISVVPPDTPHGGDRHASEPSCQACHYKLDPMAGFFKDRALLGIDFSGREFLVFDDNATIFGDKLAEYRASWPVTGYIRSLRDPDQNETGSTIEDLLAIIRRAPEARQCLTRRLAEYVLGRDQVFDGAWINHLASHFDNATSSSQAFRQVVTDLVLSNTFRQQDPERDRCYDYWPSEPPPGALPCSVAHIVRTSCVMCHRSASSHNGRLSLKDWVQTGSDPQGQPVMGFLHLDENGQQRSRADSFGRLAARLNSGDPDFSMPLGMDMSSVEKARLYKWVLDQQAEVGQ